MWKNVFWDMGGTMIDTYPQLDQAFVQVIEAAGESIESAEVAALTRISTAHAVASLSARFHIPEDQFTSAEHALKRRWLDEPPPVMPYLREVLDATCGLNMVVTHRERSSAQGLLDALQIRVDDMVCAPDGFARKPDPQMYLELARRHQLAVESCVGIGDRPIDAQAAHAAGMSAVMLLTPGIEMPQVADAEVTGLEQMLPLLG